jgi:hypothetical protein
MVRSAVVPPPNGSSSERRDKRRIQFAGHRWAGEHEGPLARGAAAGRLVERAKAWAEQHGS